MNKPCNSEILREEFLGKENILENTLIGSDSFIDKLAYIHKIENFNIDYLNYIDRLKEDIEFVRNEHFKHIKRLNELSEEYILNYCSSEIKDKKK